MTLVNFLQGVVQLFFINKSMLYFIEEKHARDIEAELNMQRTAK